MLSRGYYFASSTYRCLLSDYELMNSNVAKVQTNRRNNKFVLVGIEFCVGNLNLLPAGVGTYFEGIGASMIISCLFLPHC